MVYNFKDRTWLQSAPENTGANVIDLGGETSIDGAMNTLNIGTQKTTLQM